MCFVTFERFAVGWGVFKREGFKRERDLRERDLRERGLKERDLRERERDLGLKVAMFW